MGAFDDLIPSSGGGAFDDLLPPKAARKDRTAADYVRDIGVTAIKGAVGLPQAFVGLADIPTLGHAGRALESIGYRPGETQKALDGMYSEATQDDKRYVSQADGFIDTLGRAIERPSTIATSIGESIPQWLGGAGIARGLIKAAPAVAPWLAGAMGEGVLGAGSAASQIRGESADGLLTPGQAAAAVGSGVGTAVLGAAGGKLASKLGVADVDTMLAQGAGKLAQSPAGFVKQVIGSGISEGVFEELPQSMQEQMWQNYATGKPISEGVGNAGAMGLLAGAAMGGAGGGYNASISALQGQGNEAGAGPAANAGAAATTQPTDSTQNVAPALADTAQSATNRIATQDTTAAEKALHTPVVLTDLDRVGEIDQKATEVGARLQELNDASNGYGPMFDQERLDLTAQSAQLQQERQALAKNWPKAIEGTPSSFTTEAGARVEAKYALMDAADLVTSHDTGLRQNPAYPQELQPRARDRAASEMQVSGIVQKLDPARLGLSADAANGAPIVGADGLVESGNARTIALMRVYQSGNGKGDDSRGSKAHAYREFLRDNAAQFGITPESVDSLQKPVLVRVRTTPVNRAEFARQANASTVAQMSPSEQAKSDASRIDSMEDLTPDDGGDFSNAASKPFIRRFMSRLPATEQAGMIDATGNLSTAGYARVRNAVLAKAYGDSPVLSRMTESMDDNLRNVSRALMLAAPKVAAMREAVGAGNRFDADITPDLMSAVEELSRLKDSGTSVDDALAQAGMFGDKYSAEARALLQFLAANMRRPRKIAEFITAYMDALDAAGDPNQGSLLGDTQAPAKQDLLKAAERNTQDATQDTERGIAGKDAQDGEEAGGQRQDAQGSQGGAQGDGTARDDTGQRSKQDTQQVAAGERSEWVDFPKETGTIGIPRADMPQIKGEHRGALIQFLQGRGISHKTEEIQASDLKPTQAEFSTKKAARWSKVRNEVDRSVLASNDGHILDGHHQWVAALAANEPVKAIVLDAPIRELMANVFQFPSVHQSEGADLATGTDGGVAARQEFKQAMADLADVVADALGTRVMMMPAGNPKLLSILVRLFDSAIRVVGTDLKAATKWVKAQLKANAETKPYWNKITDKDYQEAALAALEQSAKDRVDDLFSAAEKRQQPANYKAPELSTFLTAELLNRVDGYIEKYSKESEAVPISDADMARATGLLEPVIAAATAALDGYSQKIGELASKTKAMGYLIGPVKTMDSSAKKLASEENGFDLSTMRDILRSTIVVNSYDDAQAVLDQIYKSFDVEPGRVKNRTPAAITAKDLDPDSGFLKSGYGDVLVNVIVDGVKAEIQINVPEMLAVKAGQGHALYEIERAQPSGSEIRKDIASAAKEIYSAAYEASLARSSRNALTLKNMASSMTDGSERGSQPLVPASNSPDERKKYGVPSGNLTTSVPDSVSKNVQPGGKESGTFIGEPFGESLTGKPEKGYSKNRDAAAAPRTAVQIAHDIGKSSPEGDVQELREQARKAIIETLGQQALDDMGRGHMFRNDDLTQAIHDGQYAALKEYAAAMPTPVRESDIPRDTAIGAYSGVSHSPERRGASAQRGYVRDLSGAWRTAERMTHADPEARARVTEVMADLVAGYRERYLAALHAQGRVMSSMIVGPARFPVAANRKKSDTADRRAQEASDFLKKGIARLSKAARAPIDKSPDAARAQVQANLDSREAQQARMKAVNAAHAKFVKDPSSLDKSDLPDTDKTLIREYTPKYSWEPHPFAPYELTNNNAEIKRLRARLAETEKRVEAAAAGPVESSRPGVRVEENAEDDRLRLFFDEKPGEAVRTDLKANGFRWSPNAGAWQRQLTDNARHVTQRLLDKHFPTGEAESPRLSRGSGGGMDVKVLKSLAYKIRSNLPNMPDVHVLDTPEQAPAALRAYIELQGAMDDAEGAMHNGELYLFASGMSDALRAEHVLAEHEAAHIGLRAILGGSLNTTMLMVYNNNTYIRQLATELQKRGKLSNVEATEEAIVDIPSSRLVKLQGWRKVVVRVRDWLESHGFENMAGQLGAWLDGNLTEQQLADMFVADLVRSARDYIAGKREGRFDVTTGTMLSGTLAEDVEKQEKWLSAEAQARGFKDIDQLAEQDYPLFEKLAKLWRERNPAKDGVLLSRGISGDGSQGGRSTIADQQAPSAAVSKLNRVMRDAGWEVEYIDIDLTAEKPKATIRVNRDDGRFLIAKVDALGRANFETFQRERSLGMNASTKGKRPLTPLVDDIFIGRQRFEGARSMLRGMTNYLADNASSPVALSDMRAAWAGVMNEPAKQDGGVLLPNESTAPDSGGAMLSRATPQETPAERAEKIIQTNATTAKPLDVVARTLTKVTGLERLTSAIYDRAGFLLDRYTPENVKAGLVSDYGVPNAVIDQRALMQGRQRVQLRKVGTLVEKLSTLTRAESRVAYEWMNETDPHQIYTLMQNLPEESVKILMEVQGMVDKLSREAVRLGQLTTDAYERNKFAYLRRSYAKYTLEQTPGQKATRARAISILGEQYKGRGLTEAATMKQIQSAAPDWWQRKLVAGKADAALKGEKLVRLERRAPAGDRVGTLPGVEAQAQPGKLLEVHYFPAGEKLPAKYTDWISSGTFEVRDTKGDKAILWRDFTKDEREKMGEIDEARFAIAKTLHGMIHDVEVGRYLEWLAHTQAKKEGETIPGEVVDASERYKDTFAPGTWVRVPDSKINGTGVQKYGKLAGRYLPGPVWNDLRQTVNGQFKPFGETYSTLLSWWKTSKTALSPAVHTNNIMSNFVMADWHDVTAGHTAKALRILLGAHGLDGKGALGTAGNKVAGAIGATDREAAREIVTRYQDSGGDIGSWATNEIARGQIEPMLEAMEKELADTGGNAVQAQVGVYQALQHALMMRFPSALEAFKGSKAGKAIGTEASTLLDMYQSEDEVFRLAAWLKAKEEGKTDMEAGKIARRSFMDYNINAPWVQAMRNSVLPFFSYTYRAVPMMLETAAKKPHKLLKLMAVAGALNAFGLLMAGGGGGDDKERKLLPEEKAGRIWGMVPKLIRMPWNDDNGSPVYLDIRRFIPVGDVFDIGAGHSAVPLLPSMTPGGPLALMGELVLNKQQFTGKPIVLETDTAMQKAAKVLDYLYKAFMPNLLGLPGTYATTGVVNAATGKTDAFGRQQSTAQALASSFGVKLGSYPADVLMRNLHGQAQAQIMEIDKNISALKRQRQMNGISDAEFSSKVQAEHEKRAKVMQDLAKKLN